ncbi:MAG: MATE family efflux transporter [Clostridiales bacterium]|nr:MATE family efflux transporter [Clostridiales bacterium]
MFADHPEYQLFPNKRLVRLIIPLIIEQSILITVSLIDAVMLTSVHPDAYSAISLVDMINNLVMQVFMAIGAGGAIVASQFIGKRDRESALETATQTILLTLAVSLSIALMMLMSNRPLLGAIYPQVNTSIMGYSRIYFALSAISYPAYAMYNCGVNMLYAQSNSSSSMKSTFLMYTAKVALNLLFIRVFNLGVWGIGLATILSRLLGAGLVTHLLLNRESLIHYIRPFSIKRLLKLDRRIFKVAGPAATENSLFLFGKLIVGVFVAGFSGTMIAANSAANTISAIASVPASAINLAAITVISQCVGGRLMGEAEYNAKRLLKMVFIAQFTMAFALFLLVEPLVNMLNLSPESSRMAIDILRIYFALTFLFEPTAFGLPNTLRAAGDNKFTMYASILSMVIFRVGSSFLFTKVLGMGIMGVWYGMYLDWIFRSLLFILRFRSGKWKQHSLV